MLTYLFNWLDTLNFPGAGMFNYLTFRASIAFILALICAAGFGRKIIDYLQKKQIGETIRNLDLEGQMSKKGTPTMGGVIILLAIIVPCLLIGILHNIYMLLMLFTTIFMGAIGFMDDYIKVFHKNKDGLNGKYKIFGQVGIGLVVGLVLYFSPQAVIVENRTHINKTAQTEEIRYASQAEKSTQTTIPFFKNNNFDYADLFSWAGAHKQMLGWVFFVLITIFIVTAVSNGANLTDGIDGLAAGTSAIQGVALGILAYVSGNINNAAYLNIMYIPGAGELFVYAAAFIGATIGFLWYNSYPAQVFMGDTGSLALGGIIAVFAVIIHKEILLPILAGIFLVENLSVIMQTTYFKITKKKYGAGRRIFKMSPLHHHFQKAAGDVPNVLLNKPLQKIPESKITVRFWLIGIILAALTLITLKMR